MNDQRVVGSDRVLAVLLELAQHPNGISLDELARSMNGSKPTIHRALASLRRAGLAQLTSRGIYELGDDFVRIAYRYQEARPETSRIEPLLTELSARFGETAHYAVLDGGEVVYRAKVDPPAGAIRLSSTIGGRNPAYCTAVGKLLTSFEPSEMWVTGEARTEHTITDPSLYAAELELTRARQYGLDDQENEVGVNCVAVPVQLGAGRLGAVSVSGLAYRCSLETLVAAIPEIRETVARHLP